MTTAIDPVGCFSMPPPAFTTVTTSLKKDYLKPCFKCHPFLFFRLFYQYHLEKTVTFSSSGTFNRAFKSPKNKNLIQKENPKNFIFPRFFETIERCRERETIFELKMFLFWKQKWEMIFLSHWHDYDYIF